MPRVKSADLDQECPDLKMFEGKNQGDMARYIAYQAKYYDLCEARNNARVKADRVMNK